MAPAKDSVALRIVILPVAPEIATPAELSGAFKSQDATAAGSDDRRIEVDQPRIVGRAAPLDAVRRMAGGAGCVFSTHVFAVLFETAVLENAVVHIMALRAEPCGAADP